MPNPKISVLSGKKPYSIGHTEIIIINYDILSYWQMYLSSIGCKVLIFDEVHNIKNGKTKRTKAAKKLANGVAHIIGLSGTPIENRPFEIYTILTMIDSSVIPNFKEFTKRYCNAKFNGFAMDYSGASNTEELHKKLTDTIMIRRLKKDVLPELPDKIYSFVPMELTNREEYLEAQADFINYIERTKGFDAAERATNAEALAIIEGLKQLVLQGKIKACIDWIEDFLSSGNKLVVFAVHTSAINMLMEAFEGRAVKIDGSVSMKNRQIAVDSFQNDDRIRLFVGQSKAAAEGITLTAASFVAHIELPWTPGRLSQCNDRCHRIGQKDTVNINFLLAEDTIEEKIALLLDAKTKILDSVLNGEVTPKQNLLIELMNSYLFN